jgi:hypothetical protein
MQVLAIIAASSAFASLIVWRTAVRRDQFWKRRFASIGL